MNILMFFKFISFNIESSSRKDVCPEPSDRVILKTLIWGVHVLVDDQVFVEAFEESTFGVDSIVNCIVFVVIIELLRRVVVFPAMEVRKVDVVHAGCSGRVSIFLGHFESQVGTLAIFSSRHDVEALMRNQRLVEILWLKGGWVDATFRNAEFVDHVLTLMNPLVAQVGVLVDVAALVEGSGAAHGGLPSGFHLHHRDIPALRDLVMADSEHLGLLLVEFHGVLNQDAVSVAFPVNGGPITTFAEWSLASLGSLNLHVGDVLFQGLGSIVFVAVGVVELDRGSAHVVFCCLLGLLPLFFFIIMIFIVVIVVQGIRLRHGLFNCLLRSGFFTRSGYWIFNMNFILLSLCCLEFLFLNLFLILGLFNSFDTANKCY